MTRRWSATAGTPPGPARTPDPDAGHLARLRAGDEVAFAELVDRWSPSMLRLARGFVRSNQAAEDVVQDAWLGVVAGLHRFEGRCALRTWVFTIVANRGRSHGVREARCVPWSTLEDEDGQPTVALDRFQGDDGAYPGHWTSVAGPARWAGDPERRAIDAEIRGLVEAALQDLPLRQRITVTLRDVLGMDADEACAVLGVSAQNQRVLLHRGRAALRNALETHYVGDTSPA